MLMLMRIITLDVKAKLAVQTKRTPDTALDTFKSLFSSRASKKESAEQVDLEAVKKKFKTEKELLKSIFERASKSPSSAEPKSAIEVCNVIQGGFTSLFTVIELCFLVCYML